MAWGATPGLNISMKRADKSWIFQISLLPSFGRWGSSRRWHKHSSHEQVLVEENWFDIIFWEVAHIPWLILQLVVFISKPKPGNRANSCSLTLESWCRSACHRRFFLLGCLRFVCTLKWWNHPEMYFLHQHWPHLVWYLSFNLLRFGALQV